MRRFETDATPPRDVDTAVASLVRGELHAGEAMATAIQAREALLRLSPARNPVFGGALTA